MAHKRKLKTQIKEKPVHQTVWPLYFMGLFFLALPIAAIIDWKTVYAVYFATPHEWKVTQGTVITSRLEKEWHAKGGTSISAEVEYTYSVQGQHLQNDTVRFGSQGSSSEEPYNSEWIVHNYPAGRQIKVYYLSSMPEVSTLEPKNTDYTILMAPLLSLMVAIGFFSFALNVDLKQRKK